MSKTVAPSIYHFLKELDKNNNKDWFAENKPWFQEEDAKAKAFFAQVMEGLRQHDDIEDMKAYRIYRDVRFSKDKTPYKTYRSCSYKRATEALRGGYHVELTPGGSFIALGFWMPNKEDIFRIRKEFEMDDSEIREILADKKFHKHFGGFYKGEELKTAPKGFDKEHSAIDLIRKKNFMFQKMYTDEQVLSENFYEDVLDAFQSARPFLDYMSDVLTTNLNGESII